MRAEFLPFVTPLSHPVPTCGGVGKAAFIVALRPFFVTCHYRHPLLSIKQQIKEKVMKSIEVYREKINNRQKGSDGSDGQDKEPLPPRRLDVHTYIAHCYILWGIYHRAKWKSPTDRRVYHNNQAKSIGISLTGTSRKDALLKLDTNAYEFSEWWS